MTVTISLGLLAFAIVVTIVLDREGEGPAFLTNRLVIQALHWVMEMGFVLATACICSPRKLRHVRPVLLWKVLAALLRVVYGMPVILIPLVTIASLSDMK